MILTAQQKQAMIMIEKFIADKDKIGRAHV